MKLPSSLVIKGKTWLIKRKWNLRDDKSNRVDGLCVFSTRTIFIDHMCLKLDLRRVFLHEINHAILFELHVVIPEGADEVLVDGLASVYLDLFTLRLKT